MCHKHYRLSQLCRWKLSPTSWHCRVHYSANRSRRLYSVIIPDVNKLLGKYYIYAETIPTHYEMFSMLKLSITLWTLTREWGCSKSLSCPRHQMEWNSQLRSPAVYPPQEKLAGGGGGAYLDPVKNGNDLYPCWKSNLGSSVVQLITWTLYWLSYSGFFHFIVKVLNLYLTKFSFCVLRRCHSPEDITIHSFENFKFEIFCAYYLLT